MSPLDDEASVLPLWWFSFWTFPPSPHRISGAQPEWPSGPWTPLSKALLPEGPALGRVLAVPNLFHWWIMEATVLWGTFNSMPQNFFIAFLRSGPRHNTVSKLCRQFFWHHGFVLALICIISCETLPRHRCVPFLKFCPNNWICHRWTPNQSVETS